MSNALTLPPVTLATTKAGLSAGTTTTYTTANTVQYAINGKAYLKAAVTNGATPTVDVTTGNAFNALNASQGCAFLLGFDSAGAIHVSQGGIIGLDTNNQFIEAPQFPSVPDSVCPFGYLIALAGTTLASAWTFGTNNLSSVTGMTYNFQDILSIPGRPQVS